MGGPDEVHRLIEHVERIRDSAVDDLKAISTHYSSMSSKRDARVTTFHKFINVLNSLQLALTFISKHLLHKPWWEAISRDPLPHADIQVSINEFDAFVKVGFVHTLFSSVESSLRLLPSCPRSHGLQRRNGGVQVNLRLFVCFEVVDYSSRGHRAARRPSTYSEHDSQ